MPYIKKDDRPKFDKALNALAKDTPNNAGELNYLITRITQLYTYKHDERYQVYNDIIGALEGIKLELYRRRVAYYEDKKINENGDV